MASLWAEKSGINLATINEGMLATIALPVVDPGSVKLISGKLPPGLEVTPSFKISGTPEEVPAETEFRFVLRAQKNNVKEDRTFSITVLGADAPSWVTPSGLLPVGYKQTLFVLDGSLVNYQLEVVDPDTRAGQKLSYFIPNNGGTLPPGLSLSEDGRITGVVDPILALEQDAGRGRYDENRFDKYPYDFGIDDPDSLIPNKLNQFYQFEVAASDGDTVITRVFDIFVVGDDFLRADNTILEVGFGIFTADNTYVRTPIWLTPSDLGTFRANNNITIFLDTLDVPFVAGAIQYFLLDENPDGTDSVLPPGCEIDNKTGEIFGRLPNQSAISKDYTFSVLARRIPDDEPETSEAIKTFTVTIIGEIDRFIRWKTNSDLGSVSSDYTSTLKLEVETATDQPFVVYTLESGSLPPGLELASTGEIEGRIDKSQIVEDTEFNFTVKARETFTKSEVEKNFTVTVLAKNSIEYADIYYLPLQKTQERKDYSAIISDSEIFDPDYIYRADDKRFGIQEEPKILVYAGLETVTPENYVAAVATRSSRRLLTANGIKVARARELGTRNTVYEVVYLELSDSYDNASSTEKRIKNSKSLLVNSLSKTPKTIIGSNSAYIIIGTRLNPDNKLFFDYDIPVSTRQNDYTLNFIEDSEVQGRDDSLFIQSIGSSTNIKIDPVPINTIKTDSTAIDASLNKHVIKNLSSTSSLREELRSLGNTEREYLPLWMKTAQEGSLQELGFNLAMPICYCKPGTGDLVKNALEFKGYSFENYSIEIDRILLEKQDSTQYFVFPNYEFVI